MEGAILRMKAEGGPAALDRFKKIVFETVLQRKEQKRTTRKQRINKEKDKK